MSGLTKVIFLSVAVLDFVPPASADLGCHWNPADACLNGSTCRLTIGMFAGAIPRPPVSRVHDRT